MKLRRPHLKLMYVLVSSDELQDPFDILLRLKTGDWEPIAEKMLKDMYLGMVEHLTKKHSPPFKGGEKWDNRR